MDERRVATLYDEYVVQHGLERTVLLSTIRARFERPPTVLYPGCFVHVTPSFYFQHVIYVDRNELAREFFAESAGVLALINNRKRYSQSPYVRFLAQDYTSELPFPHESFELLLSLFAPGVSRACARYLRPGGLLLSNDHMGDAREAAGMGDLELCAVLEQRRDEIRLQESDVAGYLKPASSGRRRAVPTAQYERAANYYLFRRKSS